jgi:hypothetical protein
MARVPVDQRPPIAQWLIRARESRGPGYTVDRFLAELAAEEGHAPSRSNYAQWESGAVTPRDANLAPVIAFWGHRDVPPPGAPAAAVADPLTVLVDELREWRTGDRDRIAGLETLVGSLAAQLQLAQERLARLEQLAHPESTGSGR